MSNPLRSFRKHQKKLIVFFGIMLMFAFIVVPSIIQNMQSEQGGGYANPTVATWKHGEIKREDLRRMALERAVAREFLSDLDAQAHPDAHPFFRGRGFESKVQLIGGFQHEQSGLGSFGNQALVLTMLLAEKAKDLGFVVSDKAIVDYLSAVCEGTIDSSQFEPRFRDISNGRITYQQFVEHLRTELLALNMQTIIANGSVNLLPVDVLDANMRMNRMVRAEVIPIDVSEYVAKVTGEPSDSELQALYEEGKDRYPHADYAEPGFRRIYATVVEYFKADRDAVIEKEMRKVTDKEIQEYYDKHKDADFRETALPIGPQDERNSFPSGIPGHGGFDFPGGAFPGGNLPSGFPGSDFPGGNLPRDFPGGGLPGGSPFPSGFDFPPAGSGNDTDSAPKSDSAPDNDGEGGVTEPQTTPESNEPEATDGALNALPRGEYFVSLLEDDEPGTAPAGDAKAPDATESGDSPKTESQPAEPAPKPEKKVEYRPLKEVEAEIRRTIATQRADAKINDSTSQVERTLDRYFRDAARWKSRNSDDDDGDDDSGVLTPADLAAYARQPGVTPIDYQKIADEHGLVFGRTEDEAGNPKPLDFFSFDDHELGKSDTIKQVMLNPDLAPYVVKKTSDSSNPRFVYWKTQVVKEHLPALSEIRDEVVAAWRLAEARKLAEQKAKEMAEDARQSGKSLHERFGASVKETNYFTWMSTGGGNLPQGGGGMEVSKVNNVETPGDEFMKPVFDLREGEIGVAFNQPQSMVYVVRIANETQTPDELREDFLKRGAAVLTNVGQVMTSERQQFQVDWFDDLEKEMELEWLPQEPDDGQ